MYPGSGNITIAIIKGVIRPIGAAENKIPIKDGTSTIANAEDHMKRSLTECLVKHLKEQYLLFFVLQPRLISSFPQTRHWSAIYSIK